MFYLSCFIFMFQPIDYQLFRKMKHNTSMFHLLKALIINRLKHKIET